MTFFSPDSPPTFSFHQQDKPIQSSEPPPTTPKQIKKGLPKRGSDCKTGECMADYLAFSPAQLSSLFTLCSRNPSPHNSFTPSSSSSPLTCLSY